MSKTLDKKDIIAGDFVYYSYDMGYRTLGQSSQFHVSKKASKDAYSLFERDLVFGLIRNGVFHYVQET